MELFLAGGLVGLVIGVFVGANVGATENTFKIAKQKQKVKGKGKGQADFANNLEVKEKRGIFGFLKGKRKTKK